MTHQVFEPMELAGMTFKNRIVRSAPTKAWRMRTAFRPKA